MKKKLILMGVAAALVTITLIGGSLAYFQATGHQVQQQINTKTLEIQLSEAGQDGSGKEIYTELPNGTVFVDKIAPGSIIPKEVCVTNTKDTDLYVRLTITKYWGKDSNSQNDADLKAFEKDMNKDAGKIILEPVNTAGTAGSGDWILQSEDKEQLVLYYTKPLAPGQNTSIFMDRIGISSDLKNEYADLGIALKMQADAVQTLKGQDAMMSEWGVLATIDGAGNISSIEE